MIWDIIELFFDFLNLFSSDGKGKKNNDKEAREHFKNLK